MNDTGAADQPIARRRSHLRRYWLAYLAIAVAGTLGFVLIRNGVEAANNHEADGRARDAAVAAYAKSLSDQTNGALAIDVMQGPNNQANPYRWDGDELVLRVDARLGNCVVEAEFLNVPRRPATVSELGELTFTLPSVNDNASSSRVPATAEDLYAKVMASALAHCVAGDMRFMPNFSS